MDNSISHDTTLRMLKMDLENTDILTFLSKYTQPCLRIRKHEHLINDYIIKEYEAINITW